MEKLKTPIVGMGKIDVLMDEIRILSLELRETATVDVAPGEHVVQCILNGVFTRTSTKIKISCEDDATVKTHGKYSRMWGNLTIKRS